MHYKEGHKILLVTKCTRPAHMDFPPVHVLPAKAKTSVSAKQTCCEYQRHVNYPTKNLAAKSAFLRSIPTSASLQRASIQPTGKSASTRQTTRQGAGTGQEQRHEEQSWAGPELRDSMGSVPQKEHPTSPSPIAASSAGRSSGDDGCGQMRGSTPRYRLAAGVPQPRSGDA